MAPVDRVLRVTVEVLGVAPAALKERRRNSDLRGVAARLLCRQAGLTHREAAAVLGMAKRLGGRASTPAPRRPFGGGARSAPPTGRHREGTGKLNTH